jgi:hypothetical protein
MFFLKTSSWRSIWCLNFPCSHPVIHGWFPSSPWRLPFGDILTLIYQCGVRKQGRLSIQEWMC